MQPELADAWGEFLSRFPWDWFLTLTFAEPVGSYRAHRLFGKFAEDIEKTTGRPIGWFRGDEYGAQGGRFHMHALMLNTHDLVRMQWLNEWNYRAGWARILPFDPTKGATFYCSKYVTKEIGDWDFSTNLSNAAQSDRPSQLLLCQPPSHRFQRRPKPRSVFGFASGPTNRNTAEDRVVSDLDKLGTGAEPTGRDAGTLQELGSDGQSPR